MVDVASPRGLRRIWVERGGFAIWPFHVSWRNWKGRSGLGIHWGRRTLFKRGFRPTREELDALALREHLAAHPTPPSGRPVPGWEKIEEDGALAPPKTTMFRKPDGAPLIEITLRHTLSRSTRLRRRRDG